MTIDRVVLMVAGLLILISVALSHLVNTWWLVLAAFVGLNMLQAAFTRFCPLAIILKKIGVKPGVAFD
jgi:hypothetical protein